MVDVMDEQSDPEDLAKLFAFWRRLHDFFWLGLAGLIVGGGGIAWYVKGNSAYFYAGLFYSFIPLMGFFYYHFILFNRRRDPIETQKRVVNLYHQHQANARASAVVNGSILLIASPILIIVGMGAGAQYGIAGVIIGGIAGSIWLVGGILLLAWWRRTRQ